MKKRSAASSSSKPPEPAEFFLDASFGRKVVPTALRAAGAVVHVHDETFGPGTRDEVWLEEAGRRAWIVLTRDKRIRYRASELSVLRRAGVRAFVLAGGNMAGPEMAAVLTGALPAVIRFAARNASPFVATISRSGRITRVR